jgi:hypothetical protein
MPSQSDHPWNRGWRSESHPRRSDHQALCNYFVACFVDFSRTPRGAHDFGLAPCSAHDSTLATRSSDVHNSDRTTRGIDVIALPAALLASPSGCTRATDTASTSTIITGKGRTGYWLTDSPCRPLRCRPYHQCPPPSVLPLSIRTGTTPWKKNLLP